MYFIFEIAFRSEKNYIVNQIRVYAKKIDIEVEIVETEDKIIMIFNKL